MVYVIYHFYCRELELAQLLHAKSLQNVMPFSARKQSRTPTSKLEKTQSKNPCPYLVLVNIVITYLYVMILHSDWKGKNDQKVM